MTELKNIVFCTEENIDLVEPMWEKIKLHHQNISPHFSDKYSKTQFSDRKQELLNKTSENQMNIYFAKDTTNGSYIGYCISSISGEKGEIDSIFVERNYRSQGIGQKLLEKSLQWIQKNGPKDIKITVAVGNEKLLPFYENFGFLPRHIVLENKE